MPDRPNLGEILRGLGRIRPEQQDAALEYQQEHGGFFGEALIQLGFISPEELEFGLASQFDLPYVFPDPEAIDREVACLVTPTWALANLAVPISRHGGRIVVVVDSPLKDEAMAELARRTGFEVDLAIASPGKIRNLIREVYEEESDDSESLRTVMSVEEFLAEAMGNGGSTMGISVRGRIAVGWWRAAGESGRSILSGGWARDLEDCLVSDGRPFLSGGESSGAGGTPGSAILLWEGRELPARVEVLGRGDHREILLTLEPIPLSDEGEGPGLPAPPESVVRDARLLRRSGPARFAVRTLPPELGRTLLPALPRMLFGRGVRAVRIVDTAPDVESSGEGVVLSVPDRKDDEAVEAFVERIRSFHFDALTVGVEEDLEFWVRTTRTLVPLCFVPLPSPDMRSVLADLGVSWEIEVQHTEGEPSQWRLFPLNISY